MKVDNFDVMKAMSAGNKRIYLAPLSNILRVQKVKAGTQITIGIPGDFISAIANCQMVGGLILADSGEFHETKRALAASGSEP